MQPENEQDTQGNWTFHNEDEAVPGQSVTDSEDRHLTNVEPVNWTASEFISHHKDAGWYASIIGGFLVLGIIIYIVTKDVISIVAISIVVVLFLIASAKKPQQRPYQVDSHGISIGEKFYPYSDFKSFALRQEGAIGSITLIPLKRLMPELSIYFAPEDEARIVEVLVASLPNDQRKEQGIDRLMKRLHF